MQNFEELSAKAVWSKIFYASCVCPACDLPSALNVSITLKSIRVDCKSCNAVFFYRRIAEIAKVPAESGLYVSQD